MVFLSYRSQIIVAVLVGDMVSQVIMHGSLESDQERAGEDRVAGRLRLGDGGKSSGGRVQEAADECDDQPQQA